MAEQLELPFSQVSTAIAFLRERGIIERFDRDHTKRSYAVTDAAHLDAMLPLLVVRGRRQRSAAVVRR